MQTRFFPDSAASRFGLLGIVAALLMFSLPVTAAFAQGVVINEGDDVQYNAICQNIIGSIGRITQDQEGSATAVAANGESTSPQEASAVAEVAQEQGVSIAQVNECLNGVEDTGTDDTDTDDTDTDDTDTEDVETDDKDLVLTSTIPDQKVLANTGGPALLLPALALLLISSVAIRNLLRR